jgi:hypothetical protein
MDRSVVAEFRQEEMFLDIVDNNQVIATIVAGI